MAPTEEGRTLNWIRRFRRKGELTVEDESSQLDSSSTAQSRFRRLKSKLSRKQKKPHTLHQVLSWTTVEDHCRSSDLVTSCTLRGNGIGTESLSGGSMKQMSVDLNRHQKCVTNLATTVVRQSKQIREMEEYIDALHVLLRRQGIYLDLTDEEYENSDELDQ
eukprot:g4009.t1